MPTQPHSGCVALCASSAISRRSRHSCRTPCMFAGSSARRAACSLSISAASHSRGVICCCNSPIQRAIALAVIRKPARRVQVDRLERPHEAPAQSKPVLHQRIEIRRRDHLVRHQPERLGQQRALQAVQREAVHLLVHRRRHLARAASSVRGSAPPPPDRSMARGTVRPAAPGTAGSPDARPGSARGRPGPRCRRWRECRWSNLPAPRRAARRGPVRRTAPASPPPVPVRSPARARRRAPPRPASPRDGLAAATTAGGSFSSPASCNSGSRSPMNARAASTCCGYGSHSATSNPARANTIDQARPISPAPTTATCVMANSFRAP